MRKLKIAVVTSTRAEYGILRPLITRFSQEEIFDVQLLVTGTHLSEKHGSTRDEIVRDGIKIYAEIPILEEGNRPRDISVTMANAICRFARYFEDEKPDLLIVLGDRTEILGICCAAMNAQVPIAHLHGGELTEGAVDDCVRHAITKMSYLHFPAAEEYRRRIIRMGEAPERVFAVGALGVENIFRAGLLAYGDMCAQTGIPLHRSYVVVTFHPVTLEDGTEEQQTEALIRAIRQEPQYFYLITKANADAGGDTVNRMFEMFADQQENVRLVASLGMVRYLSVVKYSAFVLGNSSSGIIEAPALGIPVVNIGDRQRGRLMAETIINCPANTGEIVSAMRAAGSMEHRVSRIYGDGNTSERIVEIVKKFFSDQKPDLKKQFYDLSDQRGEGK